MAIVLFLSQVPSRVPFSPMNVTNKATHFNYYGIKMTKLILLNNNNNEIQAKVFGSVCFCP